MKWTQYFSNFNIHFKMNHFIYQVNFDNFAKFYSYYWLQGSFIFTLLVIWTSLFSLYYATLDPFQPRYVNKNRTPGMSFRWSIDSS